MTRRRMKRIQIVNTISMEAYCTSKALRRVAATAWLKYMGNCVGCNWMHDVPREIKNKIWKMVSARHLPGQFKSVFCAFFCGFFSISRNWRKLIMKIGMHGVNCRVPHVSCLVNSVGGVLIPHTRSLYIAVDAQKNWSWMRACNCSRCTMHAYTGGYI